MVVVVLTAVPVGLRGQLTRWMIEVAPGVFVGNPTARVRDLLWERITEEIDATTGRALLVRNANNEQGLHFLTHGHEWEPIDLDGIKLMLRPTKNPHKLTQAPKKGWSTASRRRRHG